MVTFNVIVLLRLHEALCSNEVSNLNLSMDDVQKKLKDTEEEINEIKEVLKEELQLYRNTAPDWRTLPNPHYISSLENEKSALMQKELALRNEIISLRDNATPQGKTIINQHKY